MVGDSEAHQIFPRSEKTPLDKLGYAHAVPHSLFMFRVSITASGEVPNVNVVFNSSVKKWS